MKSFLVFLLLAVAMGCSSGPASLHPLDGKSIVLEGRWNALAKESGQIICDTDPNVVDVIGVDHLATPKHEQLVRVTAVLHWRGMDPEDRRRLRGQPVQLIPDGYIIHWSEAKWEVSNNMKVPNKPDAVNPALALWFAVEDLWCRVTDLGR